MFDISISNCSVDRPQVSLNLVDACRQQYQQALADLKDQPFCQEDLESPMIVPHSLPHFSNRLLFTF